MAQQPASPRNQLRIIGGKWRGRKLDFPSALGLRPTGDRIRETLFNWLMPHIVDAHCLDLFAGSGALGLEALSRGAASAVLVDNNPEVCRYLQQHQARLDAANLTVLRTDSLAWLQQASSLPSFGIVFLDPPFDQQLLDATAAALETSAKLEPEALIYVEAALDQVFSPPANWQLLKSKQAGQVSYALYQRGAL